MNTFLYDVPFFRYFRHFDFGYVGPKAYIVKYTRNWKEKKRIHTEVIEMKEICILRYVNIISVMYFKSNTVNNAFENCVLHCGIHVSPLVML
jgi:hypothetical protein